MSAPVERGPGSPGEAGEADLWLQVRRYLEDLVAFEGPRFVAPEAAPPVPASAAVPPAGGPAGEDAGEGAPTERLEAFRLSICECTACPLGRTRQRFVFGAGNPAADVLFVGEAPGADEDRQGEPFVGAAGQLLTRIIEAIQLRREEVYICNVLKCRPPNNRDPLPEEVATCEPYLKRQIEIIRPRIICALGRHAAHCLLKTDLPMRELRGHLHQYEGIPVVVTYHPAALLRDTRYKRATWEDVKWLRRELDGVEL
ncbi:MAG: uracil-DNA glycosylase [Gemmatimonadota bacterium]